MRPNRMFLRVLGLLLFPLLLPLPAAEGTTAWAPSANTPTRLLGWEGVAAAKKKKADFTVDSTADLPDANLKSKKCRTTAKTCTLRAALEQANALGGPHTINVPAGTYTLARPGEDDTAAAGDLDILANLTITGADARQTVVEGGGVGRVFDVLPGASATLSGLTIRRGAVDGNGGGIQNDRGILTIVQCTISGSSAFGDGGGVFNNGTLTIVESTISGNSAANSGAGITNGGTLTISNSTISGNTITYEFGAAIGGGLRNFGAATLRSVTLSGNSAPIGGGGISNDAGSSAQLEHTVVANSLVGGNCAGTVTSQGSNLDSGSTCGFTGPGDRSNTDPRLGPLANNGGPTDTHALSAGSPAIDAGSNSSCPPFDQRGIARPRDGNGDGAATCDIGAYER